PRQARLHGPCCFPRPSACPWACWSMRVSPKRLELRELASEKLVTRDLVVAHGFVVSFPIQIPITKLCENAEKHALFQLTAEHAFQLFRIEPREQGLTGQPGCGPQCVLMIAQIAQDFIERRERRTSSRVALRE